MSFSPLPPQFQQAAAHYVEQNRKHYGPRLVAIYAFGSAARGETVEGSDLDAIVIAHGGFTRADAQWELARYQTQTDTIKVGLTRATSRERVENALGLADGLDCELMLAATLFFDSQLLWGQDLCARFRAPTPDKEWGHMLIQQPLSWLNKVVSSPEALPDYVPTDPIYLQSKLARWVLYGGACWLMGQSQFCSFRGHDVLPLLGDARGPLTFAEYSEFLSQTARTYNTLISTSAEEARDYARRALRWMKALANALSVVNEPRN